jgi:hypothetical protein
MYPIDAIKVSPEDQHWHHIQGQRSHIPWCRHECKLSTRPPLRPTMECYKAHTE